MTERYVASCSRASAGVALEPEEILEYLRTMDCNAFDPLESLLVQTEAMGDPATPSVEQMAILKWLGAAFQDWERLFPLEEPLATEVRRLKPLLAALSITDPAFLIPGAHPLHLLLDTIQSQAIGWQPRLGRVGQTLEKQVSEAVDAALAWFDTPSTDLVRISKAMASAAAKARAHAGRMAKRLEEAEQGRRRITTSKREAAMMVNAALARYPVPARVGKFLKGPWYDSAQLALLKYGEDSTEWVHMAGTTTRLMESLQDPASEEGDEPARRQYIFELVSQLAKDLRSGLYSLQHDREAVDHAVHQIETVHRDVLREQALELETISPIPVDSKEHGEKLSYPALDELRQGQWFILDTENSPSLRVALLLRIEDEQQLLFVNHAGMKVLEKSFAEFAGMVERGKVTPLDTGASFSRCLARSAGIETTEDVDELTGVAAEKARLMEQQRSKSELERQRLELEKAEQERAEQERLQRKRAMLEQLQREEQEAERSRQQRKLAEQQRREQAQQERLQLEGERENAARLQEQWEEAAHQCSGQVGLQREVSQAPGDGGLHLPRCTWVGFREDEQEELALLAAYQPEHDQYLFVDRYGQLLRKLSGRELLIIITRGVADILASRSRFRDEVSQALALGDDWRPGIYSLDIQQKGDSLAREDRNRPPGLPLVNTIYIELESPEFGSKKPGTLARVRTEYVWRHLLRLSLEHPLPAAAILQLALELPGSSRALYLVAEVKSSRPVPRSDPGPGWSADLALLNVEDTDIEHWLALIDSMPG